MTRWHELRSSDETDRGDSPIPTVIIWVGIAVIAVGLLTWAGLYINGYVAKSPSAGTFSPPAAPPPGP